MALIVTPKPVTPPAVKPPVVAVPIEVNGTVIGSASVQPPNVQPPNVQPPALTVAASDGIIDLAGNIWSITTSANAQVAVNGVVDTSTDNVVLLMYDEVHVYHVNSAGNAYSKVAPADAKWVAATLPAIP